MQSVALLSTRAKSWEKLHASLISSAARQKYQLCLAARTGKSACNTTCARHLELRNATCHFMYRTTSRNRPYPSIDTPSYGQHANSRAPFLTALYAQKSRSAVGRCPTTNTFAGISVASLAVAGLSPVEEQRSRGAATKSRALPATLDFSQLCSCSSDLTERRAE